MLNKETLRNYADLTVKIGVNLQKGQGLEISCPVERADFARALTESAFAAGASRVFVNWEDDEIDKLNYLHGDTATLCDMPKWQIARKNYLIEHGFCYIAVAAEDPDAFVDIPSSKLAAVAAARAKLLKKYSDAVMNNEIRWCVVSVPTEKWAQRVFKGRSNAVELLENAIERAVRLRGNSTVAEWQKHSDILQARADFLNAKRFDRLRFVNSLGTDLTVGLADDHVWLSAKEKARDGIDFIANIPTEEVFTAPHKDKADGVVYSALPLAYNGKIIDKFKLTFKKGKITDVSAERGEDVLKALIDIDGGTKRLGEVALIGKNSPVAKSGILFFNTLFDENAACHLAVGKAYPTTVRGGDDMSLKQLKEKGVNDSSEHVDFMIGTPDLSVVGYDKNGAETVIFDDGDWVI